jgi:dipeptidyl peptidase-like protein
MVAGEEFALLDVTGGWAWGYRRKDHKVGYLRVEALA